MLDTLARICHDAGRLLGVVYSLFEGDPRFVTSVALQFESLTLLFRAVADDDTLATSIGPLAIPDGEVAANMTHNAAWAGCLGREVCWAWRMTNQQGYTDGVRLEFGDAGQARGVIVELEVTGSSIRAFRVTEVARN